MPIQVRVQPLERDIRPLLSDLLSPQKRSMALAQFARVSINEAKDQNRRILGRVPPMQVFVDGTEGAPLESVQPGGIIVANFVLIDELLRYIKSQLETHSPFKTGRYKSNHILLADGTQVDIDGSPIPTAEEYVFTNLVPYARKIERGSSTQAPEGVYQTVAHLAQRQFRGLARITFSFRTVIGGVIVGGKLGDRSERRNPAIIIRQR